jgi:hypothetical protein
MEHCSVPENRVGAAKQGLGQVAWNRTSQGAGKRLITRLYGKEQARTTPGGMLTPYCTNPKSLSGLWGAVNGQTPDRSQPTGRGQASGYVEQPQ